MNNIEPINNIYQQPDTFKRHFFHRSNGNITRIIKNHAYNICRNVIPQAYINNSINKFKYGYIYKIKNEIIGFIIWKIINNNINEYKNQISYIDKELHIVLICTDSNNYRFGTQLLYDVEQFALLNGIKHITLNPANDDLITFYEKNGYRIVSEYPQKLMLKNIEIINIKKTRKTLRKSFK